LYSDLTLRKSTKDLDADCAGYAVFYYTLSAERYQQFPLLLTTIEKIIVTKEQELRTFDIAMIKNYNFIE